MGLDWKLKQQYEHDSEARAEREYYQAFNTLLAANKAKYLAKLDDHPLTLAVQEALAEHYEIMEEHNFYGGNYKYQDEFEEAQMAAEEYQGLLRKVFKL